VTFAAGDRGDGFRREKREVGVARLRAVLS